MAYSRGPERTRFATRSNGWRLSRKLTPDTATYEPLLDLWEHLRFLARGSLRLYEPDSLRCDLITIKQAQRILGTNSETVQWAQSRVQQALGSHIHTVVTAENPTLQALVRKDSNQMDIYLASEGYLKEETRRIFAVVNSCSDYESNPPRISGVPIARIALREQSHRRDDYIALLAEQPAIPFRLGPLQPPQSFPPFVPPQS